MTKSAEEKRAAATKRKQVYRAKVKAKEERKRKDHERKAKKKMAENTKKQASSYGTPVAAIANAASMPPKTPSSVSKQQQALINRLTPVQCNVIRSVIKKKRDASDRIVQEHEKVIQEHKKCMEEHQKCMEEHQKIMQEQLRVETERRNKKIAEMQGSQELADFVNAMDCKNEGLSLGDKAQLAAPRNIFAGGDGLGGTPQASTTVLETTHVPGNLEEKEGIEAPATPFAHLGTTSSTVSAFPPKYEVDQAVYYFGGDAASGKVVKILNVQENPVFQPQYDIQGYENGDDKPETLDAAESELKPIVVSFKGEMSEERTVAKVTRMRFNNDLNTWESLLEVEHGPSFWKANENLQSVENQY